MRNTLTSIGMLFRSIRLGIVVAITHYQAYRSQSKLADKALKQLAAMNEANLEPRLPPRMIALKNEIAQSRTYVDIDLPIEDSEEW